MSSAFWEGLVKAVGLELGFDERTRLGCCRCENHHEQSHGDRDARVVSVSLNRRVPPRPWDRQFAVGENTGNCLECQISPFGSDSSGARVRKVQGGGGTRVQLCLVAATAHSQALRGTAGQNSPLSPRVSPTEPHGQNWRGAVREALSVPITAFLLLNFLFCIEVRLINNVMIVSDEQ